MTGIWSPDDNSEDKDDTIKQAEDMVGQRILKTHLSVDMLPNQIMEKKSKVDPLRSGLWEQMILSFPPKSVCVRHPQPS